VRLFVCVRPPDDVLDAVEAVVATCRADADPSGGVRWVARDKWHVTLQFLGDVASPDPVIAALDAVELPTVVEASLGPAVELLGRQVVSAPVRGLDALASAVREAVGHLGSAPPEERPFRGHLTLARLGRRGSGRPRCLGSPVAGGWTVDDIALVRSHLGSGPALYEDLFVRSVGPASP
jgi:2'-5' RNA ligase